MSFKTEATISGLTDFARQLLATRSTFWRVDVDHPEQLAWTEWQKDQAILVALTRFLAETATLNDQAFNQDYFSILEEMARQAPLFRRLNSPEIVVTNGHNGTTPLQHILRVFKELDTSLVDVKGRFMLRFAALFHDCGKGLAAGLSRPQILDLMETHHHLKHSYPSHDQVSVLALDKLVDTPRAQKLFNQFGADTWPELRKLILNHHLLEGLPKFKNQQPLWEWLQLPPDTNWIFIGFLFLFCRADIASNPNYHHFWLENAAAFTLLLQQATETEFDTDQRAWLEQLNCFFAQELSSTLETQT